MAAATLHRHWIRANIMKQHIYQTSIEYSHYWLISIVCIIEGYNKLKLDNEECCSWINSNQDLLTTIKKIRDFYCHFGNIEKVVNTHISSLTSEEVNSLFLFHKVFGEFIFYDVQGKVNPNKDKLSEYFRAKNLKRQLVVKTKTLNSTSKHSLYNQLIALYKNPLSPFALCVLEERFSHANFFREHFYQTLRNNREDAITQSTYMDYWYATLFVVIEGYRYLKFQDSTVDQLLDNITLSKGLRKYRHDVFHYHEKYWNHHLTKEVLENRDSVRLINHLHDSFKTFFTKHLGNQK
jgi:hypothetical protein